MVKKTTTIKHTTLVKQTTEIQEKPRESKDIKIGPIHTGINPKNCKATLGKKRKI